MVQGRCVSSCLSSPGMVLVWGWRMDTNGSKFKIDVHMPKRTLLTSKWTFLMWRIIMEAKHNWTYSDEHLWFCRHELWWFCYLLLSKLLEICYLTKSILYSKYCKMLDINQDTLKNEECTICYKIVGHIIFSNCKMCHYFMYHY